MKRELLMKDGYYHIFNRGFKKQQLFFDDQDYVRFMFYVLYYQTDLVFPQVGRIVDHYIKTKRFFLHTNHPPLGDRHISLINFCIMPNHFHITVQNKPQYGVSDYLHRVQTAYAVYFNKKYKSSGHVFQGAYKLKKIEDSNYFHHLSHYIHKNPSKLPGWENTYSTYPWSSLKDHVHINRWEELLDTTITMNAYPSAEDYLQAVRNSPAKLL